MITFKDIPLQQGLKPVFSSASFNRYLLKTFHYNKDYGTKKIWAMGVPSGLLKAFVTTHAMRGLSYE